MARALYIIGNGFDIHHGIPSRFSDFEKHLRVEDRSLHDLVERFLPVQEDWSDLEEALAGLDAGEVVDEASQFLMSYGADDWSDAGHHDYQYEVERIVHGLSSGLRATFSAWVAGLPIPSRRLIAAPLGIDPTAAFLTFNYTDTLSGVYEVPDEHVLFIHGKAELDCEDLVLGHGWNPAHIPSLNDIRDPESMDTRVMEGNETINDFFGKTFKNTRAIIAANAAFFKSLNEVSNVFILGHSLSRVDREYFVTVIENVDLVNVKWTVSYYRSTELESHRKAMAELGVDLTTVNFLQLGDLA